MMKLIQPRVDTRMNEVWERIAGFKTELAQLGKGQSVISRGSLARFEKLREEIRGEREYYEIKRANIRSFGFSIRSERKLSKELAKRLAV
jgi:hypothetical protein